jgi:hypothetical protein
MKSILSGFGYVDFAMRNIPSKLHRYLQQGRSEVNNSLWCLHFLRPSVQYIRKGPRG